MDTKTGIVKAISPKHSEKNKSDFNKFCLSENDKEWFATKEDLGFDKGDKISFKYTSTTSPDGRYTNLYLFGKAEVVEKKPTVSTNSSNYDSQSNAGNTASMITSYAKDVTIALIENNKLSETKEISFVLESLSKEFVAIFKQTKDLLDGKDEISKLPSKDSNEEFLDVEYQKI